MEFNKYEVSIEHKGLRLDVFLTKVEPELSRVNIQKLIKDNQVEVNDTVKKANYKVNVGDKIILGLPEIQNIDILPENITLDILYEDKDMIIINKQRGMVVHPAPNLYNGTLVNALLYHCDDLSGINGEIRPGIVHRLDKDTSGVMVVAKNDKAHQSLAKQIGDKSAIKEYIAITHGNILENKGSIITKIGRDPTDRKKMAVVDNGKEAVTGFEVIKRFENASLVLCRLYTGRTHQIRVHLSFIKHPIIGDPKYCKSKNKFQIIGQALHSYRLVINHPSTGEKMEFIAPIPDDMNKIIKYFEYKSK